MNPNVAALLTTETQRHRENRAFFIETSQTRDLIYGLLVDSGVLHQKPSSLCLCASVVQCFSLPLHKNSYHEGHEEHEEKDW